MNREDAMPPLRNITLLPRMPLVIWYETFLSHGRILFFWARHHVRWKFELCRSWHRAWQGRDLLLTMEDKSY